MTLFIYLRDDKFIEIKDFKTFTVADGEWITVPANEFNTSRLLDSATYIFEGTTTAMVAGKDILYLLTK